ncbi:hypothetical protein C8Q74DRAFT_1239913 [Fomes fomentarius]|nr:hypothetical protein C8Q74DRAFT_1239913 [Fomes fomentarius]
MSEQVARAHTSQSNRAKARVDTERKVVFRNVVENPFRVQWPTIPVNVQNSLLACAVQSFCSVARYNLDREQASTKRRRSRKNRQQCRSFNEVKSTTLEATHGEAPVEIEDAPSDPINEPQHVVVGINEVTRTLENLASSYRIAVTPNAVRHGDVVRSSLTPRSISRLVIACRGDVDPPILIDHLPNLVAACNSAHKALNSVDSEKIWLVPMSKGAEGTLAGALSLRRASVILIESSAPDFAALEALLQNVSLLSAPWLCAPTSDRPVELLRTHIKQLRTSAPRDLKAAKEKRAKERAAAKESRRRARQHDIPKRVTLSTTN